MFSNSRGEFLFETVHVISIAQMVVLVALIQFVGRKRLFCFWGLTGSGIYQWLSDSMVSITPFHYNIINNKIKITSTISISHTIPTPKSWTLVRPLCMAKCGFLVDTITDNRFFE